jgi:hypothetical protein
MALANIDVTVTESNITVDLQNTTVDVTSTTSNIVVGTASSTRFIEDVFDAGTLSGNISLDITNGTIQNVLLSGNVTGLTLNNFGVGSSLTAIFTQSGIGGSILDTTTYTSNWTNYNFANEYTDFDTNPNNYNILNIFNDGNEYYASLITETAPPVQNSDLANANIILNNTTTSTNKTLELGSNTTLSADAITEGSTNEFYTDAKSRAAVSVTSNAPSATGSLNYNNTTGVFTFTPGQGNYSNANVISALATGLTSDIVTTANVSGGYFLGNGSLLTGLPETYNDANVISLFDSYSNVINTSANVFSTAKITVGSQEYIDSVTPIGDLTGASGIAITPGTANAFGTPNFEYFSSRLDASGNPQSNTSQYGSGKVSLHSEHTGGYNLIYLDVGKNQVNQGANNVGLQAEFHAQPTAGGTEGVYTNGGFRNTFIFSGDTRIGGPAGSTGAGYKEFTNNAVIEGFAIDAYTIRAGGNVSFDKNMHAGANADSVHTFTGNINVTGNIEVDGNLNYRNVEDLYVQDQSITLNANAASDATVQIIANRPVAGTDAVIQWNETTDTWQVNPGTGVYANILGLSAISTTNTAPNTSTSFGSVSYDNSTGVINFNESRPEATFIECFAGDAYNPGVNRGQLVAMSTPPTEAPGGGDQNGSIPIVHPADAGNVQHRAFGIANVTGSGYTRKISVVTSGLVNDLDTSAFRAGDTLFMSTTEGVMSNVAPTFASNVIIQEIGKCVHADATNGIISLNIQETNVEDLTTLGNIHVNGNIELTDGFFIGDVDGAVTLDVNNNTGSTLTKGQAVYLDGGNQGDTPNVALANASDFLKMPAIGIIRENIVDQAVGQVVTSGVMNFSSHGFTKGEDLYISTTPGNLVLISPATESNLVQKIGKVVSDNHILVQGAFRENATPNLDHNKIFIGRTDNYRTTVALDGLGNTSISTQERIEAGRLYGGNITVPYVQQLNGGDGTAFIRTWATTGDHDPMMLDGSKILIQDTDTTNPLANGSIKSDNIFFVRGHSTAYGYYMLYTDEACQNLLTTTLGGSPSLANANITFSNFQSFAPISMAASPITYPALETSSNTYINKAFIRNNLEIGEVNLRDAKLDVSGDTTITNYSGNVALTIKERSGGAIAPTMTFFKDPFDGTIATDDSAGAIKFTALNNSYPNVATYANIVSVVNDTTAGSEAGSLDFRTSKAGTETSTMLLKSTEMDLNVPLTMDSNLQINADTVVGGLKGLTFDSATNRLGLGTTTPGAGLHIFSDDDYDAQVYLEEYKEDFFGPDLRFFKARGTSSSPTVVQAGDRMADYKPYGHTGNISAPFSANGFINTLSMITAVDSTSVPNDTTMPTLYSWEGYKDGDYSGGTAYNSLMKLRANGDFQIGNLGFGASNTAPNFAVTNGGVVDAVGNITTTANVSGNYILGNGSQLTGIATDTFNQIIVSGQSNVDASGPTALTLAESGDITITTDAANNKITIGGSGSGYGNAEVTTYLASGTSTGNVEFTGNLIVESGNSSLTIDNYFGNVNTGSIDQILFNSDPGLFSGQPISFSGTVNSNLVFLNGNTYFVQSAGGGYYNLFTDPGTLTGLQSGLGQENPNSLVGDVRNVTNNQAYIYGNVYVDPGATLHADTISPTTSGGTFSMAGIRASDVGLGSGGTNFFFPETGGNTEGAILTAHSDQVGTWDLGLNVTTDNLRPTAVTYQNSRSGNIGIEDIFKRSRGTTASPAILEADVSGAWDRVHETEYYAHDGDDYRMTLGEHVYIDNSVGVTLGANAVPLTKEIYCMYLGQPANSPVQSLVKFRPNKHIEFNAATGTRGFGTQGNANIQMDGSIYSAQTVDALNISPRQFLQLKNYTTTEINALTGMAAGDTVFNTTESTICFYTGSAWNKVTSTAL